MGYLAKNQTTEETFNYLYDTVAPFAVLRALIKGEFELLESRKSQRWIIELEECFNSVMLDLNFNTVPERCMEISINFDDFYDGEVLNVNLH